LSEARQGKIAIDAVRRIREQNLLDNSLSDEALMTALGSVITDPKAWLDPDKATAEEVEEILHGRHAIRVHGMALLAWCDTEQFRIVFANGAPRKFPVAGIELVRALCDERVVMPDTIQLLNSCPEGPEFVYWLLAQGVLDTS
jgi:hypothetical protein